MQNFKANLISSSTRRKNWRRSQTTGAPGSSLYRRDSDDGSTESRAGSWNRNYRRHSSSVRSPFKSVSIPEAEDDFNNRHYSVGVSFVKTQKFFYWCLVAFSLKHLTYIDDVAYSNEIKP